MLHQLYYCPINFVPQYAKFNTSEELLDMKDAETIELTNFCKNCFDAELAGFQKRKMDDDSLNAAEELSGNVYAFYRQSIGCEMVEDRLA